MIAFDVNNDSTSAGSVTNAGAKVGKVILIAGLLGTTWTHTGNDFSKYMFFDQTGTGFISGRSHEEKVQAQGVSSLILEVRRLSGLTWDELGALFGVSRRSVHNWAEGKPINADNNHRLVKVLSIVRLLDRASTLKTKSLLLQPDYSGISLFSAMQDGSFDKAYDYAQSLSPKSQQYRTQLSEKSINQRRPPPPSILISADQRTIGTKRKKIAYRFDPIKPKNG